MRASSQRATRSFVGALFGLSLLLAASGQALAGQAEEMSFEALTVEGVARVEINTASVRELCTLPGIGPKKAEAIVAFRERRPFTRVTQLLLVKGIGRRTLERLRPLVFVAPPELGGAARSERRGAAGR